LQLELLAEAPKFVARRDCRVQRTLRMVLMGHRRAEQSEDPVAGRLDDIAAIAMDHLDHQLQRRIDNRAGLFRIEIAHQRGRTLNVGKQRRHRLALAFGHFAHVEVVCAAAAGEPGPA
jgi:hypothetical protein